MTERVSKTIDVLLDAINNRTLAKGTCTACAVGNLVADAMGGNIIQKILSDESINDTVYSYNCDVRNDLWKYEFTTDSDGNQRINYKVNEENYLNTGFSLDELAAIEYTFETNTNIHYLKYHHYSDKEILQDQIKGLEAVVQVMMNFDDCKEKVEEVFTSKVEVCV